MIEHIIPLIASFLPVWSNYLIYIFALAFLAWVPSFIYYLVKR